MRQSEATKDRPFYSVSYQYKQNPWTNYGHYHFGATCPTKMNGRTKRGTDSFVEAQSEANKLVTWPGIAVAYVHKTDDCYNHKLVYEARA